MGRENINQSRQWRISMKTSPKATKTRCDFMKTQDVLILHLCLCIFLTIPIFAQDRRADSKNIYSQMTRTFHSVDDFTRLTKGKVKIQRNPTLRYLGGELIGSPSGIVRRDRDGSLSPYPSVIQLPYNEITVIVDDQPSVVWIGTTHGVIIYNELSQ